MDLSKIIEIIADPSNSEAIRTRDQIARRLRELGHDVAESKDEIEKTPFIIAIGGDGAILKAANIEADRQLRFIEEHHLAPKVVPILGINRGNRGFLASIQSGQDWQSRLDQALEGKYFVKKRTRISLRVNRLEKEIFFGNALNEFHFGRADEHIISPVIHVSGMEYPLNLSRGDGIIICTATGSTAYNASAYGQVIYRQDKLVATVICPTDKENGHSVLIDACQNCSFDVPNRQSMFVEIDGRRKFLLESGDRVLVEKSVIATNTMEFGDEMP